MPTVLAFLRPLASTAAATSAVAIALNLNGSVRAGVERFTQILHINLVRFLSMLHQFLASMPQSGLLLRLLNSVSLLFYESLSRQLILVSVVFWQSVACLLRRLSQRWTSS